MRKKAEKKPAVMMIDEDAVACAAVGHALSRRKIRAKLCLDPEEALKELEKGSYGLVLLDARLRSREEDGFDVLKRIRANPKLAGFPVFFFSNAGLEHEVARGLAAGADAYLVKSETSIGEVADRVAAALAKAREREDRP